MPRRGEARPLEISLEISHCRENPIHETFHLSSTRDRDCKPIKRPVPFSLAQHVSFVLLSVPSPGSIRLCITEQPKRRGVAASNNVP